MRATASGRSEGCLWSCAPWMSKDGGCRAWVCCCHLQEAVRNLAGAWGSGEKSHLRHFCRVDRDTQ